MGKRLLGTMGTKPSVEQKRESGSCEAGPSFAQNTTMEGGPVGGLLSSVALCSAIVVGAAGCSTGVEARQLDEMRAQVTMMEKDLESCREKGIENNGKSLVVSFGTFGLKTVRPDR